MEAPVVARPADHEARPQHRRNKSSSVFKSIINPKSYQRTPPEGPPSKRSVAHGSNAPSGSYSAVTALPMMPPDHPHANGPSQRVLSDIHNNQQNIPSSPSKEQKEERPKGLHKKTKSSVSLRSLGRDKDKEKDRETKSPSKKSLRSKEGKESQAKPKKSKSSTNLAAIFSRPKSSSKEQ
ncbi:hypothetical protein LTS18_010521, partial [Coniosporium uncinatum]